MVKAPLTSTIDPAVVVPMPMLPLVVKVVKAPVLGVVEPIAPGDAKLRAVLVHVVPLDMR
jgi:hypothetical protein